MALEAGRNEVPANIEVVAPGEENRVSMELEAGRDEETPNLEGKKAAVIVAWILGFGGIIAWNAMVTVGDYYYWLFPEYHPSRVLTMVYQPIALGAMAVCTYYESRINTRTRNMAGYTMIFISTSMLLILDLATSGSGGIGPFLGICCVVAAFGVSDVLVQGGVVGELSFMSPELIQSYYGGMAACGAMTSVLRLVTKAGFENVHHGLRKGVIMFLAISISVEFLCIILYSFYLPKLPIINYYRSKASKEGSKTVAADLRAAGIQGNQGDSVTPPPPRLSTKMLLVKNYDFILALFLTYAVSLSIFPGFISENTGTHGMGSWYILVLIAMYNGWDLIGRYVPVVNQIKLESRKGLMIAAVARFALVPAFYFAARYADKGWMIALTSVLGLTTGYLTVCVTTLAPQGYTGPEQNALGNLLVLSVLAGIFAGVGLDWLWVLCKKK
ncbi:Equilibrative nucleotide transporter 3 [Linum grandiflorum]